PTLAAPPPPPPPPPMHTTRTAVTPAGLVQVPDASNTCTSTPPPAASRSTIGPVGLVTVIDESGESISVMLPEPPREPVGLSGTAPLARADRDHARVSPQLADNVRVGGRQRCTNLGQGLRSRIGEQDRAAPNHLAAWVANLGGVATAIRH